MKVITYDEYCDAEDFPIAIIDLKTVPIKMRKDFRIRNANVVMGTPLCFNYDGTGNQFVCGYGACPDCIGTGEKQ